MLKWQQLNLEYSDELFKSFECTCISCEWENDECVQIFNTTVIDMTFFLKVED